MNFTVYMEAVAKARARTVVQNGKVHSFTPRKTEQAEWYIRQTFILSAGAYPILHKPIPIRLYVLFYLPRPKSLPKKITKPIARPDLDNLLKTVKDALEGYAWDDDSQIVTAIIKKRFGSPPRIEIDIQVDTEE